MEQNLFRGKKVLRIIFNQLRDMFYKYTEIFIFSFIFLYKNVIFNIEINTRAYNFFGNAGTILILISLTLWIKTKSRIIFLLFLNVITSIFLFADIVYSRYNNGQVIVATIFKQAGMAGTLQEAIFSLIKPWDLVYFIDILIIIPFIIYLFVKGKVRQSQGILKRISSAIAVLIIGVAFIFIAFSSTSTNCDTKFEQGRLIGDIGILNFHMYNAYAEVLSPKKVVSNEEAERARQIVIAKNKVNPGIKLKYNGISKGTNLIVVQFEALQANMIGLKINGHEVTPNLNKFLKRSIYFKNYYSETDLGMTADAEFLSNMSYYTRHEGSTYLNYPDNSFETLFKSMKDRGYTTIAMHANTKTYYNRNLLYPRLGFDKFISKENYINDEPVGPWGVGDRSFFKQSLEKLKKEQEPFAAFMITLSSHFSFAAFEDTTEFDAGRLNHTYFGNYIKSINYADSALGEFLKELDASGLMDKSTVAIYGDHWGIPSYQIDGDDSSDKSVSESGYLGLPDNFYVKWMGIVKVPLIIHLPHDKAAGIRSNLGGEVDFFPTIANLYGFKPKYALGQDILNNPEDVVIRRDCITDGKFVYVNGLDKCYDMKTSQEIDKTPFLKRIEEAKKLQALSDEIVANNMVKYFMSKEKK